MTTVSDHPHAPRSILMVCMGNICRSPTAEGVLRAKLHAAGLGHVMVDSAGTHDYHVGEPPDRRSQRHAAQRGYDLSTLRARQVSVQDFARFDLILVMDDHNIDGLEAICPPGHRHKVKLLMEFAPGAGFEHVPDPYDGSPQDFELVLDLVEQACAGILLHLASR